MNKNNTKTQQNLKPAYMPIAGPISLWMMAQHVENYFETRVHSIQYEDGTMRKFIVQLEDKPGLFVDASTELIMYTFAKTDMAGLDWDQYKQEFRPRVIPANERLEDYNSRIDYDLAP